MTRPSVLWVTAEPPNDRLGGGSMRQSHLLRRLGSHVELDLVVLGDRTDDHVRAAVRRTVEVPDPGARPPARGAAGFARTARVLLAERSTAGIVSERRRATDLVAEARRAAPGHDLVVVVHEALADAVPAHRGERWLLHLHHVAAERSAQRAALEPDARRRAVHRLEARNSARWLARAMPRWDGVITVSDADAAALGVPEDQRLVVPNGVAPDRFPDEPPHPGRRVVLTASLDYPPNIDGARWFVDHVWPTVAHELPEASLELVGRSPTPEIRALGARTRVSVHADVPDVAPWLLGGHVVVVPLRVGTGTRLKALEAMAARRPVVGTTIGLEGLGVVDGRHALVADTAEAFAAAVVRALTDPDLATRLALAAREHVERHFDWDAIARRFAGMLTR